MADPSVTASSGKAHRNESKTIRAKVCTLPERTVGRSAQSGVILFMRLYPEKLSNIIIFYGYNPKNLMKIVIFVVIA